MKKQTTDNLSPAQTRIFQVFKAVRKSSVSYALCGHGGGLRNAINTYKRLTTGDGFHGRFPGIPINDYVDEFKTRGGSFRSSTLDVLESEGLIKTHLKSGPRYKRRPLTNKTYVQKRWYITMTDKGLKVLESIA